jgi:hypothetical protein
MHVDFLCFRKMDTVKLEKTKNNDLFYYNCIFHSIKDEDDLNV